MRVTLMALAGSLVLMASAASAEDPMASTYANTVVSKDSKGMSSTLYFNQDGTYTLKATGPNGQPVTVPGKWATKDGGKSLCLTMDAPPNAPPAPPSCTPLQAHNVGDSWTVTNDQNQTYNVSLTAGRSN